MRDKGRRDRGACFGPLSPGDRVLIQNLSETEGTSKLRPFWQDEIRVIVESKGKEKLVYTVKPETNINGKVILHRNVLFACEFILEEPEGLHLIRKNKNSSTSSKNGAGR